MLEFSFNNLLCLVQHFDTLGGRKHIPESKSGKGACSESLQAVMAPWKGEGSALGPTVSAWPAVPPALLTLGMLY